ncbi:unnamed protein product, partial [Mesorhabditis belari]|uniref:G-protein coupled receptors family 1 profile domain-containing protein n=1 Tax=Mesorhabditis belari TaxID=2138241 RepID=A0AAF3EFN0_9BILA
MDEFEEILDEKQSDANLTSQASPQLMTILTQQLMIIVLTLIGNGLLAFVILRNNRVLRRKRVTPVQMLMLHMCAADLLFALITILPEMGITAGGHVFHGPDELCKFVKFIQVIPLYASAFLLVAISADRYQAICRPLASIKSSAYNRPALFAGMAWSTAIAFSTPQILIFHKQGKYCTENYTSQWQYPAYVILFNMVVWLLPSAIAGYLYYCVCKAVWQSTRFGDVFKGDKKMPLLKNRQTAELQIHEKGVRVHQIELDRRRIQTVKLTMTIVVAHFILWTPFCVISVIDSLTPKAISPVVATYIMLFGNLNSCVNPWIWFFFNGSHLRRAIGCRNAQTAGPMYVQSRSPGQTECSNMELLNTSPVAPKRSNSR